ncbi:hypothetical protein M407DRAFT_29610 [Tulasnella calospora MUT 4182]|uniref:Uncharacterized protein n=1 Tax=Tulasnella calospora MUT 4182 TaxID=1051891 RepID=A0A0C3Q9S3_9AGAM|nr:hypothetical protein M407DRAFT_29610 [Tulasnella calospora MUT 4182]
MAGNPSSRLRPIRVHHIERPPLFTALKPSSTSEVAIADHGKEQSIGWQRTAGYQSSPTQPPSVMKDNG